MPKASIYTLIWSEMLQHYELFSHGQRERCFGIEDGAAFSEWLQEHTSFAFVGKSGRFSVIKEGRSRGTGYWYLYYKQDRHTRKAYLGPSEKVTLQRLERVVQAFTGELASIPPFRPSFDEQKVAPLKVKFSPPRLPTALVERSPLLDELDAIHSHPLTLVSASAGSGKTTLLSAWIAASVRGEAQRNRAAGEETAFAWLSLEELDNDPIRFWTSCILALRTCLPTLGEMALAMLSAQEALPLTACLTTLLHEVEQVGNEILLFLDDYHVIAEQAITEAMRFLLYHLPANLHLVLISRTDPQFPLSLLRVRRQLFEIRDQDLCFSRAETSSFLVEGMGLPLSEEEVAALHTRTEGWIAGLQLAALSLSRRENLSAYLQEFSGSHRFVLDYVHQDILARLPDTLQDFVLQTSILTHMNAALCQAVSGLPTQKACQELLETLERSNLFVVPLDAQRQWYRYHDLFREALLARLRASEPEQVALLHQRAAHWYQMAGQMREAIAHALAAADYPLAVSLMEQAAPGFWRSGEARTVALWVMKLPDPVLRQRARFVLEVAYRLQENLYMSAESMAAGRSGHLERYLQRIEEALADLQEPDLSGMPPQVIQRRVQLLQAWRAGIQAMITGDARTLESLVQQAQRWAEQEETRWKLIPCILTYWLRESLQREGGLLVPMLEEMKQEALLTGDPLITLRIMRMLALGYMIAGQLQQGEQECLAGLALAEHMGVQTPITGYLLLWLGDVYYVQNRLEKSLAATRQTLHFAQTWQQVDLQLESRLDLVYAWLAMGNFAAAEQALLEAEAIYQQYPIANRTSMLEAVRIIFWLRSGNLAAAREWAARTSLDPLRWDPNQSWMVLALVQVYLACQQYAQASETLERFRKHLDRAGHFYITVSFLALSAVALDREGKREQAVQVATRLLALTEPVGYLRAYLDTGPLMKQMLKRLLEVPSLADPLASTVASKRTHILRLLALFEQEEQKRSSEHPASSQEALQFGSSSAGTADSYQLLAPLTTQELSVLRELVAGRSNREIADTLVVSLNTVKTHIKHLYSKLAVNSRLQASTRARELRLL